MEINSDVELSEDEICEALIEAKVKKRAILEMEAATQRRIKAAEDIMKPFTPESFIEFCHRYYNQRFDKEFLIDDNNRFLIQKLAQYFCGSPEFNSGDYNLNKSILIMGEVGVGKTEVMRFMQRNKKGCFKIVSCIDVAESYLTYQDEVEKVYSSLIEMPMNDPTVFFQKYIGYCFDDLGTEEVKNNYGNKKNVMGDIMLAIYNKKQFGLAHMTSNLNSQEIEERYGTRFRSRLREMYNVFELKGTDRRK